MDLGKTVHIIGGGINNSKIAKLAKSMIRFLQSQLILGLSLGAIFLDGMITVTTFIIFLIFFFPFEDSIIITDHLAD